MFFDWDKSDITPEAATILNNAVTAYGNCGTAAIMLAGHTDRSGSTQYNMGLAERRNTSGAQLPDRPGHPGGSDHEPGVRRKHAARAHRRRCARAAEPPRRDHLRPGFGQVSDRLTANKRGRESNLPAPFLCAAVGPAAS